MWPVAETHYDAEKREWSGPCNKDFYNESVTLGEVAFAALKREPEKIIQIHDETGETMTCRELLANSDKLCKILLKMGLQPQDIIGLLSHNHAHVVTLMMASFLCGTPVNSPTSGVDPATEREHLPLIFGVSRPKVLFCDMANLEISQQIHKQLQLSTPLILMNGEAENCVNIEDLLNTKIVEEDGKKFRYPCMDLHGDDPVVMCCTSGTTGPPKLLFNSSRMLLNKQVFTTLKSDSVIFGFSPMYWASGYMLLSVSLIQCCTRVITTRPPSGEYFVELLKRHKISHAFTHSAVFLEMIALDDEALEHVFDHVDTLMGGGSKIPLVVQQKIDALMASNPQRPGLGIGYGMTELAGLLTYNIHYLAEYRQGTEGCLAPNTKMRILSPKGEHLGPNQPGRVCYYSSYPWQGYYENPKANAESLRADNWLLTSDIGFMDEHGYFHYLCRVTDYFESNHMPIYPQRLEEVILQMPGALEVCVFAQRDENLNNRVACAVVRRQNAEGQKLQAQDIVDYVKDHISKEYQLTGGVHFVERIPKNASGKMQRQKVQSRFSQLPTNGEIINF